MNLKTKLAAGIIMLAGISAAQATTYDVTGIFTEGSTNGVNTQFTGTFDYSFDGTSWGVSNFTGRMNEAMRGTYTATGNDYVDGVPAAMGQPYPNNMLTLGQNLQQADTGTAGTAGMVTATIFKENTSNVFYNGGYTGDALTNNWYKYGASAFGVPAIVDQVANENAFFTLVFDHDGMGNILSAGLQTVTSNATLVNKMIYGDCTMGSLMSMGQTCMAGEPTGGSTMGGVAGSLNISAAAVSAVPVPAAAWLFGGALMSLFGANRRKSVLPA